MKAKKKVNMKKERKLGDRGNQSGGVGEGETKQKREKKVIQNNILQTRDKVDEKKPDLLMERVGKTNKIISNVK